MIYVFIVFVITLCISALVFPVLFISLIWGFDPTLAGKIFMTNLTVFITSIFICSAIDPHV